MTKNKTQEGLTVKKEDNFTEWFTQLMLKAELADYTDVSGCMVFRPLAYKMWEKIVSEADKEFKKIGVENVYFPLFIPENLLSREEDHVKGFAPEVAWVTQAGKTKLNERLAIRPTSEAIIYPSYSKWIRSYRDLPKIYNQWCSVVRWEFNNPVPFFRTREFLWNEIHSAFASEKEALEHGEKVMSAYNKITEDLMAIPGILGKKTESEKFAGAVFTKKVHSYLQNGRVIEGTCFHYDGENFAKAYDIKFKDSDEKEKYVHQNTHAITTRMLGTMLAIHSDNKGLIIPPKIAPNKIIIIPLIFKGKEKEVLEKAKEIKKELSLFSPILDERFYISAGRKFAEHELKGIPIRIEIGPKDLQKNQATIKLRTEKEKRELKIKNLKKEIPKLLEEMQKNLFNKAKKLLENNQKKTEEKKELIKFIKEKQIVKIPLENSKKAEELLKYETGGAKTLFIDSKEESVKGKRCIMTGNPADYWVYVGKTY
jgi:prolyl-tRNA synthetase